MISMIYLSLNIPHVFGSAEDFDLDKFEKVGKMISSQSKDL
jgi:hypothetical protein